MLSCSAGETCLHAKLRGHGDLVLTCPVPAAPAHNGGNIPRVNELATVGDQAHDSDQLSPPHARLPVRSSKHVTPNVFDSLPSYLPLQLPCKPLEAQTCPALSDTYTVPQGGGTPWMGDGRSGGTLGSGGLC